MEVRKMKTYIFGIISATLLLFCTSVWADQVVRYQVTTPVTILESGTTGEWVYTGDPIAADTSGLIVFTTGTDKHVCSVTKTVDTIPVLKGKDGKPFPVMVNKVKTDYYCFDNDLFEFK